MPWVLPTASGGNVGVENTPIASTVAPLGIAGSWTSAAFSVMGFDKIAVTMKADRVGTITIHQGPDGLVWNAKSVETFDPAENPTEGFLVDVIAPYAYAVFANTSGLVMAVTNIEVRRKY